MKEKTVIKIRLSMLLLIIAIIVIIIMVYIKVTENKNNTEIEYDIEIKPSEVAELYKEWQSKSYDMNVFEEFNKKYIGKIVKVTGNVSYYGTSNRVDYDYCINLESENFDRIYASCLTNEKELEIKGEQKITIIGTYMDDPNVMTLYNIKIIENIE